MATSVAPTQTQDTTTARVPEAADLSSVLSRVAAILAVAGGIIHLAVVRHHLDYAVVTAGFVLMGGGQILVAAGLATSSATRVRRAGLLLHTAIVATWLISRTVGLTVVPGAEDAAPFGFADTIANMFAIGVIASLATIDRVATRPRRLALSMGVARGVATVVTVLTLAWTVPAVLAPHVHAGHEHPSSREPAPGHEPTPSVEGHDAQPHDHG